MLKSAALINMSPQNTRNSMLARLIHNSPLMKKGDLEGRPSRFLDTVIAAGGDKLKHLVGPKEGGKLKGDINISELIKTLKSKKNKSKSKSKSLSIKIKSDKKRQEREEKKSKIVIIALKSRVRKKSRKRG